MRPEQAKIYAEFLEAMLLFVDINDDEFFSGLVTILMRAENRKRDMKVFIKRSTRMSEDEKEEAIRYSDFIDRSLTEMSNSEHKPLSIQRELPALKCWCEVFCQYVKEAI